MHLHLDLNLPATRGKMMRPDEASLFVSCLATRTQRRRGSGPAASAAAPAALVVDGRKALLAAEEEVGELAAGLASLRGRCRVMSVTGAAAAGGPAAVVAAGCRESKRHVIVTSEGVMVQALEIVQPGRGMCNACACFRLVARPRSGCCCRRRGHPTGWSTFRAADQGRSPPQIQCMIHA